ncbi:MAG: hypothetical protein QM744_14355 [Mesorhizobium sp.]
MRQIISMRKALSDPNIFGKLLGGESWRPWRIILCGVVDGELLPDELDLWHELTGRAFIPGMPFNELWCVVGRRGGKTRSMAVLSVYLASLCDWSDTLVVGETGKLLFLAATQKQARIAMGYTSRIYSDIPAFQGKVVEQNKESLTLRNGIEIELRAASFKNLRGVTCIAVLADEIAWWQTDDSSANPDVEIIEAVRPSLLTTKGKLIAISSPFARRGLLFDTWEANHGPHGDPQTIVVQASTQRMNSSVDESEIDRAMRRDPARAKAEYYAEWRSDIEGFCTLDAVRACVEERISSREYESTNHYVAFVDPSGGSSDDMTLAIAHLDENGVAVLDKLLVAEPIFDPSEVTAWFTREMAEYGIRSVVGDGYGAVWVSNAFDQFGVRYRLSKLNRSQIYLAFLPALNSGEVQLLDNEKLIDQLVGLERRTTKSGREEVNHRPGRHDDLCNSACGALVLAAMEGEPEPNILFGW